MAMYPNLTSFCALTERIYAVSSKRNYFEIYFYSSNTTGYHNRQGSNANEGMRKVLGISAGDDLYEAAGCMLRLALWPTDTL